MKITLIGASGYVGSALLTEALDRRHQITALVNDTSKVTAHGHVEIRAVDATNADELASAASGHDLVISAFNPGRDPDGSGVRAIISGTKRAGIARLLVVGGAGSLLLPSGERLIDQPDFPTEWRGGALLTSAFLDTLKEEAELDWVFLSPAATLTPGPRTSNYRVGKDHLLTDEKGESRISLADFAVAMLDEAERPAHHRERFTVAY